MDDVLRAIADPTRRRIVALTWGEERSAGDIAAAFAISRPAVSQHLRVLVEADLLRVRQEGTRRYYRANPASLRAARTFLEAFWDDRLDRLKQAAEAAHRESRSTKEDAND